MFKNYCKIAFRNFIRHKGYSIINVIGLAIAVSVFSVILLFIKNEFSYDRYHENGDNIYRVVEIQIDEGFGKNHVSWTMGPLAATLKADFPEVIKATRLSNGDQAYCEINNQEFFEENICYADQDMLTMFTIPLLSGDPKSALAEPNSIIIREEIAKKYFGNESAIGQSIKIRDALYQITGVMKQEKHHSHMKYNMLISYATFGPEKYNSWFSNNMSTYVMLQEGTSTADFENKLPDFLNKYHKVENGRKNNLQMYLQPLKNIHLHSKHILFDCHNYNRGDLTNIQIFSAIALLIILIACINFTNLTTAKATQRTKEISVRKACGSNRGQLISQFWIESILLSFASFLVTLLFVQLWLPILNSLLTESFNFKTIDYITLFSMNILVGIVAGWYPAFYLSKFQSLQILKKFKNTGASTIHLRRLLVLIQFSISILLIVSTIVIYNQRQFIRNKDLGYARENIIYIDLSGEEARSNLDFLKNEFTKNPNVLSAAATSKPNGGGLGQSTFSLKELPDLHIMMEMGSIDYDYITTMDMKVIQGRNFSRKMPSDNKSAVLINEAAAKKLKFKNPIGKQFTFETWGIDSPVIIGVVKNFHFYSLHEEIKPLVFMMSPKHYYSMVVRLAPSDIQGSIHFMKTVWEKTVPNRPFKFTFLDQQLDQQYRTEENMNQLFLYFSVLAIFISCLGLLGLSAYASEQRTKEIGIRKVLGASPAGLVSMLSQEFTKWVLLANMIAWPVSWVIMNRWLQDFAYRIKIGWWVFALAGALALIIALLTVSGQAIRAATANPVESLKYE